ncbi:hypothetical protein AVV48_gp11 [Acinetobacter phage phiAC-1]|nr:hypothetical protein AVV48_gp11 [Acinetobacter phage phiAC-1]AFU62260.1 hypothetical protein phiAC-1_0011 [Acinetobacter phage phiAC-1]
MINSIGGKVLVSHVLFDGNISHLFYNDELVMDFDKKW